MATFKQTNVFQITGGTLDGTAVSHGFVFKRQSDRHSDSQSYSQTATLHTALYELNSIAKCRLVRRSCNLRPKCVETLCAAVSSCSSCQHTLRAAAESRTDLSCHSCLHININTTATNPCNAGLLPSLSTAEGAQQPTGHYRVGFLVLTVATGCLVLYSGHQVFWQPLFCLPQSRQVITKTALPISPQLIPFNP